MPRPFLLRLDPFFPPLGVATGGRVLPPSEWRGKRPVGQSCMLAALLLQSVGWDLGCCRALHAAVLLQSDSRHIVEAIALRTRVVQSSMDCLHFGSTTAAQKTCMDDSTTGLNRISMKQAAGNCLCRYSDTNVCHCAHGQATRIPNTPIVVSLIEKLGLSKPPLPLRILS